MQTEAEKRLKTTAIRNDIYTKILRLLRENVEFDDKTDLDQHLQSIARQSLDLAMGVLSEHNVVVTASNNANDTQRTKREERKRNRNPILCFKAPNGYVAVQAKDTPTQHLLVDRRIDLLVFDHVWEFSSIEEAIDLASSEAKKQISEVKK